MIQTSITELDNVITASLSGRLDTLAAPQVRQDLEPLFNSTGKEVVLNCRNLDYISSSGLRVFLSLSKTCRRFRIEDASPEVYGVLETTGFTKIMNVSRAMRQISVDNLEVIGRGGVGTVYRIDEDTIIKVFREGTSLDDVQREISMAKVTFVLGMPTPISFDVVQVDNQYGLVYELLNAKTLSACICEQPDRIDEFARMYANLFRQIHQIRVPLGGNVPSELDYERSAVASLSRYFNTADVDLLMQLINTIPQANRLLHGDLQTKNAMMQDGELMLIDMGEVGYGHPVLDLAHAYSAMVTLIGSYDDIIGLPEQLAHDVYNRMIHYYFEGESEETVAHRIEQIDAIAVVRNFSWLALSDSFPEAVVRQCQEAFNQRVTQRKEHLLSVCQTLSDWTLD